MADESDFIRLLAEEYPTLLPALVGGGVGAVAGGMSSDEGHEGRGAVHGALLGGGLGAAGGALASKVPAMSEIMTPTATKALLVGGGVGGVIGGRMGASHIAPWIKEKLVNAGLGEQTPVHTSHKEAAVMSTEIEKKAALEKEAAERITAFDFGMDVWLAENGINKEALCQHLNLEHPGLLAPATIQWMTSQLDEKAK